MKQADNFTEGRILPPLMRFMLPVLLALFLQAMYGAVDLAVVGWFGTAADVSAVSTGSQIMQTVTMCITSLAMGTTILIGQTLGRGRRDDAGRVVGSGIALFAVVGVLVTIIMVAVAAPFSALMHAPEEAFSPTVDYVRICSFGFVLITAYNVLGSIFRGLGDSKTPLLAVAVACVCNVLADLLLVGVFHMASAGAALATVISQGVSVVLSLCWIRRKGLPFEFHRAFIRFDSLLIGKTLRLGIPIALQDALVSVSFLVVLSIVNGLGLVASAGIGVAEKLCAFIMLVPSAFMQSLSAFVAQNIGAGKPRRARKAMVIGMGASLCIGVVLAWLSYFHGDILAMIFAGSDTAVISAAADYLRAYAIDTLLVSFLFCFCGYFNGCGKTTFVMIQGIVGAFGVRIPVSYIMSHLTPVTLFHVGLATPCSTIVQIILCLAYFLWYERRRQKEATARLDTAA